MPPVNERSSRPRPAGPLPSAPGRSGETGTGRSIAAVAVAVGGPAAVSALALWAGMEGPTLPALLFVPAVAAAALVGAVWGGVLASAASMAALAGLFLRDRASSVEGLLTLGAFAAAALVVAGVVGRLTWAVRGRDRSLREIDRALHDEQRAEQELRARLDQLQALYRVTDALVRAEKIEELHEEALDAMLGALDVDRAALLLRDPDGVMRFKAWRELSEEYRAAVEGHSPWASDEPDPQPVLVADAEAAPDLAPLRDAIRREGVRALAFLPLVQEGAVVGKVTLYRNEPRPFTADEVRLAHAVAGEISAALRRRHSEEALRVSRDELAAILGGVGDGITVQGPDGELVYANDAAARTIGFASAQELVGTPVEEVMRRFELLDEDGRPFPVERLPGRLALMGQEAPRVTIRWRRVETGEERWSLVKATPVFGGDGRPELAVNIFQDITEERWGRESARILARVSEELSRSLDYEETLKYVARVLVPAVGEISVVYLLEDGRPVRLEVAHADPERQAALADYAARYPVEEDPDHPVVRVMRTGRPLLVPEIPEELLERSARDEEHLRVLRELRLRSSLIVPLVSGGRSVGALALSTTQRGRRYDEQDLELVTEVARRAATAIENAQLHRAEREARAAAERAAARTARLQAVTAGLSEALTTEQVAEVVVRHGLAALDADAGSVAVLDETGEWLEVVRAEGYPEDVLEAWRRFPLDSPAPMAAAVRERAAVLIGSRGRLAEDFPDLVHAPGRPAGGAWAALPLEVEGRVVGAIGLSFPRERRFEEDDRLFISSLAQQCAQALERARLYEAERSAREEAMGARQRLSFLAEATEALSTSLDYQKTLARFAELCIPRLADWCIVDVLEEGPSIRQVAVAHVEPEKAELARVLRRKYPPDWSNHPITRVLRTGTPELATEVDLADPERTATSEEHVRLLRELGVTSHMVVPLAARGRVFGAVSFISGASGRRYTHADLALAEDLGRRAAMALDNARLYEERSRVARTLQGSLLPARLSEIPGFEVAARYHPAGEGVDVGGDFYDLFPVGDGRWIATIGDVCGKGAEAAALTGLARHTIRTASAYETDPATVLRTLNAAIEREGVGSFCTVALGRLEPSTERAGLAVVCGGHPQPLVLRADGTVEVVGTLGTMLGVFPDPQLETRETELRAGDAVLFYTDGVVEEGRVGSLPGEQRLKELLRLCAGLDAGLIADRIERHAAMYRAGEPRDDMAILVVRMSP